ncbi:tRNA (adenosine(37)-N6)-dimethylallyltransferase MiaA [Tepidicella baoligensis]|uniref:tRNA (adenosine(37)-N6)-dimethylallyltransferase MiaA n=1 Tax=Tepidicella baoligensis TaxID=2707016 RepID=UPI0015DB9D17|nr:tRNA (adenosine(37)-N6)-dimethylallyltransferase MiaA [Tepidicella baoligensis]
MTAPCWLAIAGPTASGKTALALEIAQRWPVEIISVDSALVYRGMDIGTAKPSAAELARVPHHLIDIRDPAEPYSAAEFVRDATRLVHAIRARQRLPLLVGGTMLYFKALFEGLDDMPPAQPALRLAIAQRALARGWPALHAELAHVDPQTAARLAPNDAQRIARALEVYEATGRPISAFQRRAARSDMAGAPLIDGLAGAFWTLEPTQRLWLHQRIEQRFDAMLAAGFLDEVKRLRQRGDLTPDLPSIRCVGYRQAWEALDGVPSGDPSDLTVDRRATLRQRGIFATRQLAKRQLTWLRGMAGRRVWACDDPSVSLHLIQGVHDTFGACFTQNPSPPSEVKTTNA